jgi:hypothetical protein
MMMMTMNYNHRSFVKLEASYRRAGADGVRQYGECLLDYAAFFRVSFHLFLK